MMPANRSAEVNAPELRTLQLKVGGMSCSFCSNAIERALGRESGVEDVHVSLAHEEALIRYRGGETTPAALEATLRALGFVVRDPRKVEGFEEQERAAAAERRDLASAAVAAVGLIAVMSTMWLGYLQMRDWHVWAAWAVSTWVFAWNGRRIVRMAWGAAWRRITNQHVLLCVAALGAYSGGVLGAPLPFLDWYGFVGFPAVDFFGVVVFLTAYHLLSGYVSLVVRTRASRSVRQLLDLQPTTARVVRGGAEQEIGIEEVVVADRVRVRPGERIAVDGWVVEGHSAVDESLVTGESIPADKRPGDEVIGGSVNQAGTLLVEVSRIGEDSFLHRVARQVEEAKAMKPGIVVLVDRVLRRYVPLVLSVSLAAFVFWGIAPESWSAEPHWVRAIFAAVTVLVMGYPCALGMATPLALVRGGGMAAERGILIRSGEAFQILKDITHVVLDKTGTLTEGRPRVVAIEAVDSSARASVLAVAASAEASSEHPLGRAIVAAAEEAGIEIAPCDDFQAIAGGGVSARVGGQRIRIGSARFLSGAGVDLGPATAMVAAHEKLARTVVAVGRGSQVLGAIAIADALKPDAANAVAAMKNAGMSLHLVTGDNQRTADAVADQVGIESVRAEVLPEVKAAIVRELQSRGSRVAMVGDGINDAPALMQADVGIAIGAGTDIAIESSDVVLVGHRLAAIGEAREIGAASYRKTVQNLWLAFLFNGIGVPLAATGLVHPSWAMIAMAASVSAVLANSFGGGLVGRGPSLARPPRERRNDTVEVVLSVPTIHCAGCVSNIRTYLGTEAGVEAVTGDERARTIRVVFRPDVIGRERIDATIAQLGHTVERIPAAGCIARAR